MQHNQVTIYSNGIADFRRRYQVRKGEQKEISVSVRQDRVADVLASLNVYGDVTLSVPPRFRPSNEGSSSVTINPENALEDLATKLNGSRVEVTKPVGQVAGVLVGIHTEESRLQDERLRRKYLVVLADEGLVKVPLDEVQSLCFADEVVQNEIEKALQRNLEQIKPNSTFVTLAVDTESDEAEAILQYCIPAAAWKISYRLLQKTEAPVELHGYAIVDNDTDEDWKDFLVSVVTGEPITFSTDLAESKMPSRSHVNIVRESALGAVEADEFIGLLGSGTSPEADDADALATGLALQSGAVGRSRLSRALAKSADDALPSSAVTQLAEAHDVGDFCIYESMTPVDIPANRSAVIPVFQTTLDEARTVLHYKVENHPERPYRAIQFQNGTPYSLARGVCTVFEDGVYSGSCIMAAVKPEGECLLPHALQTGVLIRRDLKIPERQMAAIRLSDGVCHASNQQRRQTVYRIKNNTSEEYELFLDHDSLIRDAEVRCDITRPDDATVVPIEVTARLRRGYRVVVTVAAQDQFAVQITESRVDRTHIALAEELNVRWLQDHLVATNGALADDEGIRKCLSIQRALDDKGREIQEATSEIERLTAKQDRLRQNIGTGGHDDQTTRWRTELGQAEDKITGLEDERILRLHTERDQIKDELRQALSRLSAEWSLS